MMGNAFATPSLLMLWDTAPDLIAFVLSL